MIKGTHNTMSYLPVRQWWLRPFMAWGRCQTKNLTEQLAAGVRYFDLRIKFAADGDACFGHGLLNYRHDDAPEDIIGALCRMAEQTHQTVHLRILLEQRATEARQEQFRNWLRASGVLDFVQQTDSVRYIIGQKTPFCHYDSNVEGKSVSDVEFRLCEVAKHYNLRWQFLLPPSCWLWEQRRIKEAVEQTGFDGIIAEDFV
ncbi:MAG: hypothetical protein K6E73_10635 [Bacteroidales bacterium]|nr:hypothetical protein [Bacteroidales bacterium]